MRVLKKIGLLLFLLVLLWAGIGATRLGFGRVEDLRKIERIPRTPVGAVIPAEANLSGLVGFWDQHRLTGPDSGAECVYYRYTIEKKTTDSDGKTEWKVQSRETESVPFLLTDPSGSIVVHPGEGERVRGRQRHQRTDGDLRYTETRIDPGMTVFAMGRVEREADRWALRFSGPGDYVPILSTLTEQQERGSVGLGSVLLTVLGLVLLSMTMYCLTRVANIQQTLPYIVLVALTIAVTMVALANRMVRNDLQSAFDRLAREQSVRATEVQSLLTARGVSWDGDWQALSELMTAPPAALTAQDRERVSTHRVHLMRATQRAARIAGGIPERWIAAAMGLRRPAAFSLLPDEETAVSEMEAAFEPSRLSGKGAGVMGGIGGLLALVLGGLGIRRIKIKRWIENIPTVKTRGVVYGMNEIQGVVALPEGADALSGPLSQQPCVSYHYVVKEQRKSDKKTEWVTLTNERRQMPFLCRDDDGTLPVDPDGAELIFKTQTRKREGKRVYIERRLAVGSPVYVLGGAVVDPETHDRLLIQRNEDRTLPFIVSDYSAAELIPSMAASGFMALTLGVNAFMLAGFSMAGYRGGFNAPAYLTAALVPLAYMIVFFFVVLFNDLVFLRRRCDAMWANIDVALKKRFDLVPQLAAVAGAYRDHEQAVQTDLASLRSSGAALAPGQAGAMVAAENHALNQLAVTVEAYPELKANETMRDLMTRIRDLEDEVALMREGYNNVVETYNTRLATFPDLVPARLFRFGPRELFRTDDRDAVRIDLS